MKSPENQTDINVLVDDYESALLSILKKDAGLTPKQKQQLEQLVHNGWRFFHDVPVPTNGLASAEVFNYIAEVREVLREYLFYQNADMESTIVPVLFKNPMTYLASGENEEEDEHNQYLGAEVYRTASDVAVIDTDGDVNVTLQATLQTSYHHLMDGTSSFEAIIDKVMTLEKSYPGGHTGGWGSVLESEISCLTRKKGWQFPSSVVLQYDESVTKIFRVRIEQNREAYGLRDAIFDGTHWTGKIILVRNVNVTQQDQSVRITGDTIMLEIGGKFDFEDIDASENSLKKENEIIFSSEMYSNQ